MTVWPASFFFGGLPEYVEATAVPFRFPQPARANQSGLCLEHHPSPSHPHNLLRHGGPQLKHFWGRVAWRREGNRYRCRDYVGFATGFSSTPPATGGSEVSPCGEASSKQPQIGFSLLSLSVLGTGTPSTGTSETSPRGEGAFWTVLGTGTPSTDTSGPSPRGEEGFYQHFGTGTLPTGVSVASSRGKAFF